MFLNFGHFLASCSYEKVILTKECTVLFKLNRGKRREQSLVLKSEICRLQCLNSSLRTFGKLFLSEKVTPSDLKQF